MKLQITMSKLISKVFPLVIACFWVFGCADSEKASADKAAEAARKSFDAAPAELKSQYQALKSALADVDFKKATETLDSLAKIELTAEQQMAVAELKQGLVLKASTASQNGDASAAQFLQTIRSRSRSR